MSIKNKVFNSFLLGWGPASTYSYYISIPELSVEGLLIQSFSLPTLRRSSVAFDYRGEKLELPATFDTTGTWNFKILENPALSERYKILNAIIQDYKDKTNLFSDVSIYILQNEVPTCAFTLKNVWFKSRADVQFGYDQVTAPWVWDVSAIYNGIEELVPVTDLPPVREAALVASNIIQNVVVGPLTRTLSGTGLV